jgi:hypothetical protein
VAAGGYCKLSIVVNLIKTIIMVLWNAPDGLEIRIGANVLNVSSEEKYVGVHMQTNARNMFAKHYTEKASTARYCVHRLMGIEDAAGRLNPKQYKTIYFTMQLHN